MNPKAINFKAKTALMTGGVSAIGSRSSAALNRVPQGGMDTEYGSSNALSPHLPCRWHPPFRARRDARWPVKHPARA
jgi:hypothetical protein